MIRKTSALLCLRRPRDTEDVAACAIAGAAAAMGPAVRQRGSLDADASQLCIACSLQRKCSACGIFLACSCGPCSVAFRVSARYVQETAQTLA